MVDIVASDVTITVDDKTVQVKQRRNRVTIAFGDGVLNYPNAAGGVPMPSFGDFGMVRRLQYLSFIDAANGNGLVYKYDQTNKKIRIYEGDYAQGADAPLVELDAGDTPAATTLTAEAIGW